MSNLVTRIARARELARPAFAEFQGRLLHKLHCKVCGTQIGGLVPHEKETAEVVNGRRVVRQRMVFSYFNNYREALLEFADGSRHVTNICAECAPTLADPAVAEDAYTLELEQWVRDGARVTQHDAGRDTPRLVRAAPIIEES